MLRRWAGRPRGEQESVGPAQESATADRAPGPTAALSPVLPASLDAVVRRVLSEKGALGLGSLVDLVADEIMRVEQGRGAWNADIAVWGPSHYRREATQAILRMLGRTIALQSEEGYLLAVPVDAPPTGEPD